MRIRAVLQSPMLRYLAVGSLNTAFSYALFLLALRFVGYAIAYTIAYIAGIAFAYWLQSRVVFRVSMRWKAAFKFPLVYLAQYLVGLIVLYLLVETVRLPRELAVAVAIICNIPVGFFLSRSLLVGRP